MTLEEFLIKTEGDDSRHLPNGCFGATWDSYGQCWNIGPGLTKGVTRNTVWAKAELDAHEAAEFAATRAGVAHLLKRPLGENKTTVLESFAYNCGIGALSQGHPSVIDLVNSGRLNEVPAELKLFVHARGAIGAVPGLINRRAAEIRLWNLEDDQPSITGHPDLHAPQAAPPAITKEQTSWRGWAIGLLLTGLWLLVSHFALDHGEDNG